LARSDRPGDTGAPPNVQRGEVPLGLRKLVSRLAGARLCYGEPVRAGERIVIPVARVSAVGGGGWGRSRSGASDDDDPDASAGGGGGGTLDAAPVGFIEIGPEGARFEAIPDPMGTAKALGMGAGALALLTTGLRALLALRRSRRAGLPSGRRLLGRG
jgi:hypothetical protein